MSFLDRFKIQPKHKSPDPEIRLASVPELVSDAHYRARHVFVYASAAERGDFEQVGWVLAGMDRAQPGPVVRDATVTDTDALLGEVGYSAAEIAALREQGVAA